MAWSDWEDAAVAKATKAARRREIQLSGTTMGLGLEKLKGAQEKAAAWESNWAPSMPYYGKGIEQAYGKIGEMGDVGAMYGSKRADMEALRNRMARINMEGTGIEEAAQHALSSQSARDIQAMKSQLAGMQAGAYGNLAGQVAGTSAQGTQLSMDPLYQMANAYLNKAALDQQLAMQKYLAKKGADTQKMMQGRTQGWQAAAIPIDLLNALGSIIPG